MISQAAADKTTEAKLGTLKPNFAGRCRAWLAECRAAGLNLYIYEGLRTCERQRELYAQGRTRPGRKVTNAGPGQSMHQYGLAIDFVPLKAHAKAAGMFEADWNAAKKYQVAQSIAAKHGLRHLSWETPHLEDATLKDWRAARKLYGNPCA